MKKPSLPPLLIKKSPSAYYVYTYKNIWDPEKKRSCRSQCKKVGVVTSGNKEGRIRWDEAFIVEHPELEHFVCERKNKDYVFTPMDTSGVTLKQILEVKKLHAGATWVLDQIVKDSPIGKALRETFSYRSDYKKILSLAYFIILNEDNNISRYDTFAEVTRLPWVGSMSAATIGRLFKRITTQLTESFLSRLLESWHKEKTTESNKLVLALDSTSISSYSEKLSSVERGRNKDEENLPQINLLLLVDAHTGLPIFYRHYDGNVPDVLTLRRVIADSARLKLGDFMLVSDKGYSSNKNIEDCLRNQVSFIFNMKCGVKGSVAQDLIREEASNLLDLNRRDWFTRVSSVTREVEWNYDSFPVLGKRSYKTEKAKLYWHIYYDREIEQTSTSNLIERVDRINQKLEEGKELDDNELILFEEVFRKDEETGVIQVLNRKLADKLAFAGYRVLVSDVETDARRAWIAYQERWAVEEAFKTMKSRLGCSRLRVSDNRSLDGKIFVQFLATAISMMVRARIKSYALDRTKKDKLAVVYESDSKILSQLNNIMQTQFNGGYYFGEIAGKRKKYFDALGVPVPTAEAECLDLEENELEDEINSSWSI